MVVKFSWKTFLKFPSACEQTYLTRIDARPVVVFDIVALCLLSGHDPPVNPELFDDDVRRNSARILDDCFRNIGFAQIKGHGVPQEQMHILVRQ